MAKTRDDEWTEGDEAIVDSAQRYLDAGLELKQWWEKTDRDDDYKSTFDLSRTYNRPDYSFGFFDYGPVLGKTAPVMGNVQTMFFDRPKWPAEGSEDAPSEKTVADVADWIRRQTQEFALRYFLRVSDFRPPKSFPDSDDARSAPPGLEALSLCPNDTIQRSGFGFQQVFFKKGGKVRRFLGDDRYEITDLRELHELGYEWIILKVSIFDFAFNLPLQEGTAHFELPIPEESYLVVSPAFVIDRDGGEEGEIGRYGLGYAFVPNPKPDLLGYGPGRFDTAFQLIEFIVREDGEIKVQMVFGANRPEKISDIPLNPVDFGIELADLLGATTVANFFRPMRNLMGPMPRGGVDVFNAFLRGSNLLTGGWPATNLCFSKRQLEKIFLVLHFAQHYNVIAAALPTWRDIPDWLASEDDLPDWVVKGQSA